MKPQKSLSEKGDLHVAGSEVVDISRGDDVAAKYADDTRYLSPKESGKLVRKADLYICSMMCFVYTVQYMDKISNSSAAIMGLQKDLNMTGDMYSWVGSSFYLAYLASEIPMNFVLQRFPLAKTTGIIITLWGVVMTCSAGSQTYAGYIACRAILGILEAAITPSFVVITSQWYKRSEQYSRSAMWFGCNGFGTIFSSALGYAFLRRVEHGTSSIAGWRALFITLGLITVVIGVVFSIHVPNNPGEAWFYSEEERHHHTARIRENKQGYGTQVIKWYQVRETIMDPRTYLFFCITFFINMPNGGITNFQAILIKGMGFSTEKSLLIGMGTGGVEVVGMFSTALLSLVFLNGYRMLYAIFFSLCNVMAVGLLAYGPNDKAKLAGLMLWNWVSPIAFVAVMSCISSNTAGRTKKSLTNGVFLIGYCVGNLIGPQTFKAAQAPEYQTATTTMVACAAVAAGFITIMFLLNLWENRRRDRNKEDATPSVKHAEFADLTDHENLEFRYAL